jgi:hypothetical protein
MGDILMRLATGGAPVVVKRRAVNSSGELETSLYKAIISSKE